MNKKEQKLFLDAFYKYQLEKDANVGRVIGKSLEYARKAKKVGKQFLKDNPELMESAKRVGKDVGKKVHKATGVKIDTKSIEGAKKTIKSLASGLAVDIKRDGVKARWVGRRASKATNIFGREVPKKISKGISPYLAGGGVAAAAGVGYGLGKPRKKEKYVYAFDKNAMAKPLQVIFNIGKTKVRIGHVPKGFVEKAEEVSKILRPKKRVAAGVGAAYLGASAGAKRVMPKKPKDYFEGGRLLSQHR